MKEAAYWKKEGGTVICELCPRLCVLDDEQIGACGVRQVKKGKLYAMTYGKPCTLHVDPVEKKPLFHFFPGEPIFSLATIGCNLFCDFCQNWQISKERYEDLQDQLDVSPSEVIRMAKEQQVRLIAFTYTEPTVYYEYMLDIAKLAKKAGMECIIVSNGYINEKPLKELIPYISAANIDLKGTPVFYAKRCKVPDMQRIKETIITLKKAGVHVEITNLIIPGENDSKEEIEKLAAWIATAVGKETPVHFSGFHPEYRMLDTPATKAETLLNARKVAERRLDYVYIGNVKLANNDTHCPECDALVIRRPFYAGKSDLGNGKCPKCEREIPGVF